VAGHEGDRAGDRPVGDRDARVGEPADAARDPGHDAERHPGLDQGQGLLAAAPEHEGIAALEPQHPLALAGQLHQAVGNIGLLGRRPAAALACVFELAAGPRQAQHLLADQRVVDHHVGLAQAVQCEQGQEPGRARPGPGQPDPARRQLRQIEGQFVHGKIIARTRAGANPSGNALRWAHGSQT
jgi:hypothetical protein